MRVMRSCRRLDALSIARANTCSACSSSCATCIRAFACRSSTMFFFSSRRRHTRFDCDWSSDVCSSDLDIFSGLLGALHETGHAMYDLGLPQEWKDQPVGRDRGMALEESQSLLIEMIVCRSRPFVRYVEPLLAKHFGVSGPEWDVDSIYGHLTRVRRSLIRVDADELTYPLHIMLRYELEKQLLSGELAVRDLPEAWNAGMEQRLGIRPPNDVGGGLQDIHWGIGKAAGGGRERISGGA